MRRRWTGDDFDARRSERGADCAVLERGCKAGSGPEGLYAFRLYDGRFATGVLGGHSRGIRYWGGFWGRCGAKARA
jgi:hypothetical protein